MHVKQDKPANANGTFVVGWAFKNGAKSAAHLDYVPMPANVIGVIEKAGGQVTDASGKPVAGEEGLSSIEQHDPVKGEKFVSTTLPASQMPFNQSAGTSGRVMTNPPSKKCALSGPMRTQSSGRVARGAALFTLGMLIAILVSLTINAGLPSTSMDWALPAPPGTCEGGVWWPGDDLWHLDDLCSLPC